MKLTKLESLPSLDKITRVAAYARVSTVKAEALSSLANQIEHYRHMFAANPNYVLVGVFSDNGISGAKSARPEFQKMIEMAKNGEIDLIYTKSILYREGKGQKEKQKRLATHFSLVKVGKNVISGKASTVTNVLLFMPSF